MKTNPRNIKPKHKLQTVLDAIYGHGEWYVEGTITNSGGNKSVIARRLGVARQTIYNYMARWKTVEDALIESKEMEKDFVQGSILKRIVDGSDTMMIFYAKTQMKDRGYIERIESEQVGKVNITVTRKS